MSEKTVEQLEREIEMLKKKLQPKVLDKALFLDEEYKNMVDKTKVQEYAYIMRHHLKKDQSLWVNYLLPINKVIDRGNYRVMVKIDGVWHRTWTSTGQSVSVLYR